MKAGLVATHPATPGSVCLDTRDAHKEESCVPRACLRVLSCRPLPVWGGWGSGSYLVRDLQGTVLLQIQ